MNNAQELQLKLLEAKRLRLLQQKVNIMRDHYTMDKYRKDPVWWLQNRFKEPIKNVSWKAYGLDKYENHNWDGDIEPLLNSWLALANGNWVGIESATGTGKTFTLSRIVLWYLDVYKDSLVVTTAPKSEQLKLHIWSEIAKVFHKFRALHPNAVLSREPGLIVDKRKVKDFTDVDKTAWQAVSFVAGQKANEESATKAQGFHRKDMLIILEETPGIPLPTLTAFENTCTGENNLIMAVGNPDSVTDPLHTFTLNSKVKSFRVSALDHPNVVLNKEVIHGAVTNLSIERRKEKFIEGSQFYNSRVRGISPEQSVNALIKYQWLLDCYVYSNEYKKLGEVEDTGISMNAVGVDVANSETGDKACLAWGEGNTLYLVHEFNCPNANDLGLNLIYSVDELEAQNISNLGSNRSATKIYNTQNIKDANVRGEGIGVDASGLGIATVNVLKSYNVNCVALTGGQYEPAIPTDNEAKPLYKFGSLRAQMYFALREDLMLRRIKLKIEDRRLFNEIAKELCIPTFVQREGSITVEKKEDIKRKLGGQSPDKADAIVYWNWIRRQTYFTVNIEMPIMSF